MDKRNLKSPVYCGSCDRHTRADQCDIPARMLSEKEFEEDWYKNSYMSSIISRDFVVATGENNKEIFFGHPSILNNKNSCPFYKRTLWGIIFNMLMGR